MSSKKFIIVHQHITGNINEKTECIAKFEDKVNRYIEWGYALHGPIFTEQSSGSNDASSCIYYIMHQAMIHT